MNILTREEIIHMPAGREMDILVGKNIMHLDLWYGDPTGFDIPENIDYWRTDIRDSDDELCLRCPHYSKNIARAWEVVEKFTDVEIEKAGLNYGCLIGVEMVIAVAAPLAICRAALLVTLDTNGLLVT